MIVSTTTELDFQHIKESIQQITLTELEEREMCRSFGAYSRSMVFEPNNPTALGMAQYYICEAIKRWDKRVQVKKEWITIQSTDATALIHIRFKILRTGDFLSTEITVKRGD